MCDVMGLPAPYVLLSLTKMPGMVTALFLTLPFGKFAHGIFRIAALLKWAIEKRLPGTLKLGDN